jgi:hypothetical protein
MSNISSNTLFHFTPTAKCLIGILKNGFQPRYSYEECHIKSPDGQSKPLFRNAIPMVSFCDIPLSQIKEHIKTYGSYGIGMSKDWGKRKGLNPVLYLTESAVLSQNVDSILDIVIHRNSQLPLDLRASSVDIVRYVKPYSGSFCRNGKLRRNLRFYDEREWRYVPAISSTIDKLFLTKDEFDNEIIRARYNKKLEEAILSFEPDDIKYVIIKKEEQIPLMIKALREIKAPNYDERTIEILTSRIITSQQILSDL